MDDRKAIETLIFENYFDGVGSADEPLLRAAFAVDAAVMVGLRRTKPDGGHTLQSYKDMNEVISGWVSNANPEGTGRDGEILEIAIVDNQIATAIFRYKDDYYDAFSFLKIDGEWKIATKTFYQR